ncbi:NAD-dependent protein deacetylase sirtuin-2 [Haplosporangium sp. Z 27]|nr:NAD-dependent protein deacetylase sirtuin-2 [Haplosporangium sp. Z 27]
MTSTTAVRIPLKSRPLKPKPEPEPRIQILKDETINAIADLITAGEAKNIIVMTGAGISTAAGIKDFRSPGTGLYDDLEKYNLPFPEAVFDLEFFKPTITHYLLPLLAKKKLLLRSYTQNIDSLERLAGLDEDLLVEAHGSFAYSKCVQCEMTSDPDWVKRHIMDGEIPYCKRCSGLVKPSITFFGENVPLRFSLMADKDFEKCDLLIVLGTSLKVEPFNRLISKVSPRCPRLLINREKAGQDLHSGFDFEDKWKYTIQRDALFLGNCDDGVRELARLCGWEDELQAMYDAGHQELKLKKETENLDIKVENDDEDEDETEKEDRDNEDGLDEELSTKISSSSDSLEDITHRLEQSIFFTQSENLRGTSESKSEQEPKQECLKSTSSDIEKAAAVITESADVVVSTARNTVGEIGPEKDRKEIEDEEVTKNEHKATVESNSNEILVRLSDEDKASITVSEHHESKIAKAPAGNKEQCTISSEVLTTGSASDEFVAESEESKRTGEEETKTDESNNSIRYVRDKSIEGSPKSTLGLENVSESGLESKKSCTNSTMALLTDTESSGSSNSSSSSSLATSLGTSTSEYSPLTVATATISSQQPFSTCVPVRAACASMVGVDNGGNSDGNVINGAHSGLVGGIGGRSDGMVGFQMNRTKRRKEYEGVYIAGPMKSGGFRYNRELSLLGPQHLAFGRVTKRRRVV